MKRNLPLNIQIDIIRQYWIITIVFILLSFKLSTIDNKIELRHEDVKSTEQNPHGWPVVRASVLKYFEEKILFVLCVNVTKFQTKPVSHYHNQRR